MFDQFLSAFQETNKGDRPPMEELLSKVESYAVGFAELIGRFENQQMQVLLLEPGAEEAMQIPRRFEISTMPN